MLQLAGGIQGVALLTQGGAACLRLAHALQQQRARPCDAQAACRHMYTRAGQAHETPSIIPDGGPAGVTAGRSSEVNSVRPVGDPRLRRLVDDVFTVGSRGLDLLPAGTPGTFPWHAGALAACNGPAARSTCCRIG
jgi:hypothetical protein